MTFEQWWTKQKSDIQVNSYSEYEQIEKFAREAWYTGASVAREEERGKATPFYGGGDNYY